MCPQWRHAGAAPDIHHFFLRRPDVEITERADRRDRVAGSQAEHVGRTDPGRAVLSRWRRSDADVKAQAGFALRIAGEGVIVAAAGGRVVAYQVEDMVRLPDHCEGRRNIEIAEANGWKRLATNSAISDREKQKLHDELNLALKSAQFSQPNNVALVQKYYDKLDMTNLTVLEGGVPSMSTVVCTISE